MQMKPEIADHDPESSNMCLMEGKTVLSTTELHIPEGINFECSSCGNCCFQWPVPVTQDDFERIGNYANAKGLDSKQLFRVLKVEDEKLKVFSHSLEKRHDGMCEFLTEDRMCRLHQELGAEGKPAMCRLFPYTFTSTPSGTYVSLSFASSAVIFNKGRSLSEQRDVLLGANQLFNRLFPNLNLDWSASQLIDGVKLNWHQYLSLEEPMLKRLSSQASSSSRVDRILFEECERFRRLAPAGAKLDNMAGISVKPKIIDQVLVKHLLQLYFPDDVYSAGVCDIDAQAVAREFLSEPNMVAIEDDDGMEIPFNDLLKLKLGRLSSDAEDIVRRFAYCRIFSKLYFGPGFNYLSVVAGLHHLAILISLLRIRLKIALLSNESLSQDELFILLAESVRTLERRLTTSFFSKEAIAMLEVLFLSPSRLERILSVSA